MKKNIIFTAIAAILLSASCTQQDDFLPGNEAKTFTATIEQVQPQTRTALSDADGVTVSWCAGDQVDINCATYSAKISGKGEAILTYESGVAPKEGPYTAVYPASLWKTEGHNRVIEFPNVQCYEPDKLNAPMYAISNTDELTFHNICGVICFSLTGAEKIRGIYVSAEDHPLYGTVTVDWENYIAKVDAQYKDDGKGTPVLANNKIILDCGTDGVQLSEKPTKFYMYLPETTFGAEELEIYIFGMKGIDSEQAYHRTASKTVNIESNKIYTLNLNVSFDEVAEDEEALDPVLPGKFSVSAGKQVQFSRGNLQATTGDKPTWDFAPQQYSYIGDKNVSGTGEDANLASTIDLFGWSTTNSETNFGIFTATSSSQGGITFDFTGFHDWGNAVGSVAGRTWFTLSEDEWSYLLNRAQTGEASGAGSARKANINGTCGLLLLPDGFSEHESYGDCKTIVTRCEENLSEPFPNEGLSLTEWKTLQSAGCVFLPCAGQRLGTTYENTTIGTYWSYSGSTQAGTTSKTLSFNGEKVEVVGKTESDDNYYYTGRSVRLVTKVVDTESK